jgi:ABC-type antimicrobial peptide transport system permease subunit
MSVQDKLKAMMSTGDTVDFQNAAIYMTKKEDAAVPPLKNAPAPGQEEDVPPKKPEPIRKNPPAKKQVDKNRTVTPYSAASFFTLWKDKKKDIIEELKKKLPVAFDYVFTDNNEIFIYLKDSPAPAEIKKIKPDTILNYEPSGQIKIIPEVDKSENAVKKITVQVRYSMYGNNFNKRTIDIVAPDDDMKKLTDQIVGMAYNLTKNLNLI